MCGHAKHALTRCGLPATNARKNRKMRCPQRYAQASIRPNPLEISSELCHVRIWLRCNFDVCRTYGCDVVVGKIREIRDFGASKAVVLA